MIDGRAHLFVEFRRNPKAVLAKLACVSDDLLSVAAASRARLAGILDDHDPEKTATRGDASHGSRIGTTLNAGADHATARSICQP